jgi:butyryl-CoA dehydrogenase
MILDLSPEQQAFKKQVERFVRDTVAPRAQAVDETAAFPADLIRAAAAAGLAGVTIPTAYGGGGRDYVSYAVAVEAIARASGTLSASLVVTNSLVAELIARAGTEAQTTRWLRPLATGAAIGAFALSEPNAGTDAANQETVAEAVEGGYRIRGRKVWIANAEAADVAVVFAATDPGRRGAGVTAFLVATDAPGIALRARSDTLGMRGLGCMDLDLDVVVSRDDVVGTVGGGFELAMWALEGGRIAIAAQALGIGEAALDEAMRHARSRRQFGHAIAEFQAIQFMIADIATELAAARMLTWKAAAAKSYQDHCAAEAAMAKLAASEAGHRAADKAMQILASEGYRRGSLVERLFRDVRATEIYQGTSEAQRLVIAKAIIGEVRI